MGGAGQIARGIERKRDGPLEPPPREWPPGDGDVALGWEGYLAIPGQAGRAYHLRIRAQRDRQFGP